MFAPLPSLVHTCFECGINQEAVQRRNCSNTVFAWARFALWVRMGRPSCIASPPSTIHLRQSRMQWPSARCACQAVSPDLPEVWVIAALAVCVIALCCLPSAGSQADTFWPMSHFPFSLSCFADSCFQHSLLAEQIYRWWCSLRPSRRGEYNFCRSTSRFV